MQRIQGNQRPLIEDNPNNRQQPALPAPARPYLRFVGWQMVGLLAAGTAVGVASGIQYYKNTNQQLKAQEETIDDLQLRLANLQIEAVAFGEQEKAEAMAQQNPDLLLMASDITDCAGRHFKQITAFQYAIWALDWNMWEMLRKYIPEDTVREQIEKIDSSAWIKEHGNQVSWQPLIDALKYYIDNYNNAGERQNNWCNKVGTAQLMLPAHVINEYSRPDQDLCPTPDFEKLKLPRTGVDTWYLNDEGTGGFRSGNNYAWTRSATPQYEWGYGGVLRRVRSVSIDPATCEMTTLMELLKVRKKQKEKLASTFKTKFKPKPKL